MRLAIFSDTFPPPATNGVAYVAYQSAKGLADMGHTVMVFTISKNAAHYKKSNRDNFTVCCLPSFPAMAYKNERLTIPAGFSFNRLRKFKPDIIHTHTPFAVGWEAVLGAKLLKIPLIGTHHTFYDHYLKHVKLDYDWAKKLSWKITAGYYNHCDLVLCPSVALAEAMKNKGLKKPVIIFKNSINTNLFRPAADNQVKQRLKERFNIPAQSLVYMGRVSYEKSLDQVIKSFALTLAKKPNLRLMIIGDGPEKINLENLAADLKIKNNVIFTGFLYDQDLVEALQANDVFLTASKSENMPLSVLEAMAVGLPIISVREKGLAEIVKENINGFFARTDDPADLAQKTLDLLGDDERLAKFGAASRQLALEYSEEKVLKDLEKLYKKLLQEYR